MRALLVANLNATAMTPRKREVIVRALGSELKIDVAETDSRGHAADLAAQARADEFDLVIAVGGDGTVNEVVTGLLREGVDPTRPRLAVVPGGNANVFARALGLPSEPIEATGAVIERLRAGRERRIGLGRLTTAASIGGSPSVRDLGWTPRSFARSSAVASTARRRPRPRSCEPGSASSSGPTVATRRSRSRSRPRSGREVVHDDRHEHHALDLLR